MARPEPSVAPWTAGPEARAAGPRPVSVPGDRAGRLAGLCQEIIVGLLMALILVLPLAKGRWARSAILVTAAVFWAARWALGAGAVWRRTPLDWPIACFAAWALLSAVGSVRPLYSLEKFAQEPLAYFGLFYLVLTHVRSERDHRRIVGCLAVGLASLAGYGLWEVSRGWYPRGEYVRSLTAGGTYMGAFLAAAIPVAAAQASVGSLLRRMWWALAMCLGVACVVPTLSRAAWAGVGIALAFLAVTVARWLWVPLLASAAAAPLVFGSGVITRFLVLVSPAHILADTSTMDRIPVWLFSLHRMLDHPILGFGFGRQIPAIPLAEGYGSGALVVQGGRLGYAHNTFLDIGLQMGFVGLTLLLWLLAATVVALWRAWRAAPPGYPRGVVAGVLAVALAFPVRAMTNNYFADDPVILFWFLVALALAATPAAAVPSPESRVPSPHARAEERDTQGPGTLDTRLGTGEGSGA